MTVYRETFVHLFRGVEILSYRYNGAESLRHWYWPDIARAYKLTDKQFLKRIEKGEMIFDDDEILRSPILLYFHIHYSNARGRTKPRSEVERDEQNHYEPLI